MARIGYVICRSCGNEFNCADLVSGLCADCAQERIDTLAALQRQYQEAVDNGEPGASQEVADLIRSYQNSEKVRLQAVPVKYRVV